MRMHSRYSIGFAMAVAAIALAPAEAQVSNDSPMAKAIDRLLGGGPRWAPVATFSVAGVSLGMTPEQARAALKSGGFTPQTDDPTRDAWSARVSQQVVKRRGGKADDAKEPMFTMASGRQGEHVEVWYAATPDGARVSEVKYQIPTNRMDRAAFLDSAASKYGTATVQEPSKKLYCSKGETGCQTYSVQMLPHMTVEAGYSSLDITLRYGSRYVDELRTRMAAAVEAAAPKNAKASF